MIPVKIRRDVARGSSTLFLIFPIVLALGREAPLAGQAPTGPTVNLSGTWTFDIYLSDRSGQAARAL